MKVELNIPENLNEITLEQYQKFVKIEEPTAEQLLSIFLNLTDEAVRNIKQSDFNRLVAHINSLFEHERKHQMTFHLNGLDFGFIPDLDLITYGENKDVTSYINSWDTMHKAMAVLYRPIKQKQGRKYLIEDYNGTRQYSELMKQMPLGVVFGAHVFFYNLTNELLKAIPNYLEKETNKEQMNGQISVENGERIRKLIHSLKATLDDFQKLQNYHYTNA